MVEIMSNPETTNCSTTRLLRKIIAGDFGFFAFNELIGSKPEIKMAGNKSFISVHDQVKIAGNYALTSNKIIQSCISFNYDRRESDLSCFTADELHQIIQKRSDLRLNTMNAESGDLSHAITQLSEGVRLWKYCVILALLFLAIEVLLIRFVR